MHVVGVDQTRVGCPQRLLAQVPLRRPGQGVFGDARSVGHPGIAEIAGVGDQRRIHVAGEVRVSGLRPAGMGELLAEPAQSVGLDQQRRQLHPGQSGRRGLGERIRLGRKLFGG